MTTHALSFCAREGVVSLWRQRWTAVFSMLAIAVAMTVLGGFLTASANLNAAVDTWSAAAEITVYLRDDITTDQRSRLNALLAETPLVLSRQYVSKHDALARFRQDFPDLAASASALAENPLPASLEIRLRPERAAGDEVESLATRLAVEPGVDDVRFDRQWLERLAHLASTIRTAGLIAGGILIAASIIIIATVVRLSLHARRDEVEILQLMGAPVGVLRGPLVFEGLYLGGGGAVLALAALYAVHLVVWFQVAAAFPGWIESGLFRFLPVSAAVALLAGGMTVGAVGGLMSARLVR